MERTQFAGLTLLEPGESLATDGFSFQTRNPAITDEFLKIGAVTHKHDGHAALVRPTLEPSAAVAASGGIVPGDIVLAIGYTCIDSQGGETLVSPSISITTPPLIQAPDGAPSAAADYTGGELRADTYFYVKTWVEDGGGETTASPYAQVTRDPGFASGRVQFNNLASGMAAAGAVGWKLYKANFTGQFKYLASGDTNTFTDDGTICADCITPPPSSNTTRQRNTLYVTVPNSLPANTILFRVYVSEGGGYFSPSLMGEYPVSSAGALLTYTAYTPSDGRPPDVATAVGGANQIDPDTDILAWSWKRPVDTASALPAGASGDVRLVRDTHRIYTPSAGAATGSAGWMEVPGNVIISASGGQPLRGVRHVVFALGSAAAPVVIGAGGGASAMVFLPSGAGGGGGGGSAAVGPADAWTNLASGSFATNFGSSTFPGMFSTGLLIDDGRAVQPVGFYKDQLGRAWLQGVVEVKGLGAGQIAPPTRMFTLPVGSRPLVLEHRSVDLLEVTNASTWMWWRFKIEIRTNGDVFLFNHRAPQFNWDSAGSFHIGAPDQNSARQITDRDQIVLDEISFRVS